ncbi:MAG: hypothetical protein HZB39_18450, partial [Planctomycetes bacterium]|nr:hypothetical protein [Planctomycetota bacterium]
MRLDPVYLVAPEPEKPTLRLSRRAAFGLAAMTFAGGIAAGRWLIPARDAQKAPPRFDDPELAWVRAACDGPLDDLVARRHALFGTALGRPEATASIAVGVQRLIDHALAHPNDARCKALARELVEV